MEPRDLSAEQEPVFDDGPLREATPYPKANLGRRFLAHLIDAVLAGLGVALVGLVSASLGGLVGALYFLVRDGLTLDWMDRRSIGKRLMKLRPIRLDGAPVDLETSVRRNWMWTLGYLGSISFAGLAWVLGVAGLTLLVYEAYRVVTDPGGRRWGDELAGTQVIDATG
ncbi:RDD family protein [Rhodocaloribacter litoris]|uniref:RDD family protein n=1 Tax=Rhodocaloribacter litoris TaxID=2558931 RepID=UPI00141F279F|nr:RDD family protein [Rhodocaloribacter litoris]QXD14230.1 RDD family protein [Rhodocaloribacter litoris]GIV59895.1 MAG: transporter [Rhodothermaceae bacterium]